MPDLTLMATAGGYTFGPHVCLPRGARYPLRARQEGPPLAGERAEFPGLS